MCKTNTDILREVASNFIDTIHNVVFKAQKFINIFHFNIQEIYACEGPILLKNDILGFVVCESEEILKNKLLKTSVDIKIIIQQKFNNICNKISSMKDDTDFYISPEIYNFFQDECNLSRINNNRYNKSEKIKDELIYDLEKSFKETYDEYAKFNKNVSYIKTNKKETLNILKASFDAVYSTICQLSNFIENSPSVYNSLMVIHELIRYMILSYFCVSEIRLEKPE